MIKQLKKLILNKFYAKKNVIPRQVFTIQFDDQDIQYSICLN